MVNSELRIRKLGPVPWGRGICSIIHIQERRNDCRTWPSAPRVCTRHSRLSLPGRHLPPANQEPGIRTPARLLDFRPRTPILSPVGTPPDALLRLVDRFSQDHKVFLSGDYKEEQLRLEFLNPFFTALGWDMDNKQGLSETFKQVIHEESIKVAGATKAPDYTFAASPAVAVPWKRFAA